jgi:hypothetical protein
MGPFTKYVTLFLPIFYPSLPPPQALVASWEGHTQSGEGLRNLVKKNGAGVTSANKFIHNLENKQLDIKKRCETCLLRRPFVEHSAVQLQSI